MKSGKQHMNKIRSLVEKNRSHKKKKNQTDPGAEEYNEKMEEVNRFNNRLHHIAERISKLRDHLKLAN